MKRISMAETDKSGPHSLLQVLSLRDGLGADMAASSSHRYSVAPVGTMSPNRPVEGLVSRPGLHAVANPNDSGMPGHRPVPPRLEVQNAGTGSPVIFSPEYVEGLSVPLSGSASPSPMPSPPPEEQLPFEKEVSPDMVSDWDGAAVSSHAPQNQNQHLPLLTQQAPQHQQQEQEQEQLRADAAAATPLHKAVKGRGGSKHSGPLPSPGEKLVGVVGSQWPLANPRGLLPGDIILRLGPRGQQGTLRAPFTRGIQTVRQYLARKAVTDDVALLQVLRGSSKLELLVSLSRAGDGDVQDVLEGVSLSEGSHSMFTPLAARTEHNILRLERMKAYGLALEVPSPRGGGGARGKKEGHSRHLDRKTQQEGETDHREGKKAVARRLVVGEGEVKESESDSEGEEEEEDEEDGPEAKSEGALPGTFLSVAASVLPSDPLLIPDEEEINCLLETDSISLNFDRGVTDRADETTCSVGSADTAHMQELMSGAMGFTTHSAPGVSAINRGLLGVGAGNAAPGQGITADEQDSALLRVYARPSSPHTRLIRHLSQPLESGQEQQQQAVPPSSGQASSASGNLQIKRHRLPERHESAEKAPSDSHKGSRASLFTILVLPSENQVGVQSGPLIGSAEKEKGAGKGKQALRRFSDVNHTVERAMRWFEAVKSSGVALRLMSAQTEVLPLRLGGMGSDKLAKVAQYGKWIVKTGDSTRGDHVSVLRAVRLWLVPLSEVELTLVVSSMDESCPAWGLQLSQTAEGIVYVSAVAPGSPAHKAGLHMLLCMAEAKQQLLVVSKIQSHVLIPAMITDDGIDCVNISALHEQLVLHAHVQSQLHLTVAL